MDPLGKGYCGKKEKSCKNQLLFQYQSVKDNGQVINSKSNNS